MKKIIALVLALCMVLDLAACGGKTNTAEEGKLIMATNAQFPPYEYYEGDKIIGIDAEIAELIAKELGMELEITDMDFNGILGAVMGFLNGSIWTWAIANLFVKAFLPSLNRINPDIFSMEIAESFIVTLCTKINPVTYILQFISWISSF